MLPLTLHPQVLVPIAALGGPQSVTVCTHNVALVNFFPQRLVRTGTDHLGDVHHLVTPNVIEVKESMIIDPAVCTGLRFEPSNKLSLLIFTPRLGLGLVLLVIGLVMGPSVCPLAITTVGLSRGATGAWGEALFGLLVTTLSADHVAGEGFEPSATEIMSLVPSAPRLG